MINFVAVIEAGIIANSLATKNAWKEAVGSSLSEEEKASIGSEYIGICAKADKVKIFCRDENKVLFSACHVPVLMSGCDAEANKLLLKVDLEKTLTDLFGENSFMLVGEETPIITEHA